MEIDAQTDAEAKAPKVDEGGDSWSDTSGEYSVVSDGGASASAESTTEEVPKGQLDSRFIKGCMPKRRFTHCPEKKNTSTHLESYPRRPSTRFKPYFKQRGRCLRNKLETIFEHPVVTADDKVVFLRKLRVCTRRRKFSSDSRLHRLIFGSRHGPRAFKMSVEEVDQLMMNLDIQQDNPVT